MRICVKDSHSGCIVRIIAAKLSQETALHWLSSLCEAHMFAGIEIDDMPHLKAWMKRIEERPAVQKGLDVPEENMKKQLARDPQKREQMIEAAKKMMTSHK